jgi:hypothetical protein
MRTDCFGKDNRSSFFAEERPSSRPNLNPGTVSNVSVPCHRFDTCFGKKPVFDVSVLQADMNIVPSVYAVVLVARDLIDI